MRSMREELEEESSKNTRYRIEIQVYIYKHFYICRYTFAVACTHTQSAYTHTYM